MTKRIAMAAKRASLFDAPVLVRIGEEQVLVTDAMQARACLVDKFANPDAPSYVRAFDTCEAFLAGRGSAIGVQAAFVVAVMEAGMPFEVQDIDLDLLEAQLDLPSTS